LLLPFTSASKTGRGPEFMNVKLGQIWVNIETANSFQGGS